jgi:hypothetical protein
MKVTPALDFTFISVKLSTDREDVTTTLAGRKSPQWAESTARAVRQVNEGIADAIRNYPRVADLGFRVVNAFADRMGTNFSNLFYKDCPSTVEMRWGAGSLAQDKEALKKYVKHCMSLLDESFTGETVKWGEYTINCKRTQKRAGTWEDQMVCDLRVLKGKTEVGKMKLAFEIE